MSAEPIGSRCEHEPSERGKAWDTLLLGCRCESGGHRVWLLPTAEPHELGRVERMVVVAARPGHSTVHLPEVMGAASALANGCFPAGLDLSGLDLDALVFDEAGRGRQHVLLSGLQWAHRIVLTPRDDPTVVRELAWAPVQAPLSGKSRERRVVVWPTRSSRFGGDPAAVIGQGALGRPVHFRADMSTLGSVQAVRGSRRRSPAFDDLRSDVATAIASVLSALARTGVIPTGPGADSAWAWPRSSADSWRNPLVEVVDAVTERHRDLGDSFLKMCRRVAVEVATREVHPPLGAAVLERVVLDDREGHLAAPDLIALSELVGALRAVKPFDRLSLLAVVPPSTATSLRRGPLWVYPVGGGE